MAYTLHLRGLPVRSEGTPLYWHTRNELARRFPHQTSIYLAPQTVTASIRYDSLQRMYKDIGVERPFPYETDMTLMDTSYQLSIDCHPHPRASTKESLVDAGITVRLLQEKNWDLSEQLSAARTELQKLKKLKNVLSSRRIIETFVKRLRKHHRTGHKKKRRGVRSLLNCQCDACQHTFAELSSVLTDRHGIHCSPRRLRMVLTLAYSKFSEVVHQLELSELSSHEPHKDELAGVRIDLALHAVAEYAGSTHGCHHGPSWRHSTHL